MYKNFSLVEGFLVHFPKKTNTVIFSNPGYRSSIKKTINDQIIEDVEIDLLTELGQNIGSRKNTVSKVKSNNEILEGDLDDDDIFLSSLSSESKTKTKLKNYKTSKKSKVKNKVLRITELISQLSQRDLPKSFIKLIKNAELDLIKLTVEEQKEIVSFFGELNTKELLIIFLLFAENEKELDFLKKIFFSKQFIDSIFKILDYRYF